MKNEREREKRLNKEAGFIYDEGRRLYKNEDWENARTAFLDAQEVVPDYKRSQKYLRLIDKKYMKNPKLFGNQTILY